MILLALIAAAPWPFAGVDMTRFLWPVPLFGLACWMVMLGRSSAPTAVAPWAAVPVVLALGFAAFQLTPIPGDWLATLSPKSLSHWRDAQALTQPVGAETHVTAPISLFPEGGKLQITWLALGLCVFILSAQFLRTEFGMIGLFGATTLVGASLAVFAVIQGARYKGQLYWFFELTSKSTPFGPFINRNHGGAFMNLCLAGAVGFLWFRLARGDRAENFDRWSIENESLKTRFLDALRRLEGVQVLAFACVVFVLGGLVSSLSRGAVASAAAGLAVVLVCSRMIRGDHRRGIPVGLYLSIVVLLTAAVSYVALIGADSKALARFNTVLEEGDVGQKSRARHWRDMAPAVQDFRNVGAGLGSYVHVHRAYTPNDRGFIFEHADNTYLEILVEMGWIGAVLLLLFVLFCVRAIFVVLRRDGRSVGRAFGVACAYVLSTQALHHAVDFPLYSPANLLLFSAWMGALCGRAGRIASAARSEGRSLRLVSLPLGRWKGSGALPIGLLIALGLWSWREGAGQEELGWALRAHGRQPATAKTPIGQVDRWVQQLDALAAEHPDRAELRYHLAERWIGRCRVQATAAALAADPKQNEEDLWKKSELLFLYGQVFGAARKGQGAVLEAVRQSPAVGENLPRAKEHLLAACQLSPLFAAPRIRLAEMAYLLDSPAKREMLVDQAAKIAPGDADVQFRIGVLEFHADRRDNVIPAWRRSLEISQEWLRPILFHANSWIGFERTILEVVPHDPLLLVHIGEQYLFDANSAKQREFVFRRALEMLPGAPLSKADRNEIAGRIYLGLGEYSDAVRCLEQATGESKGKAQLWLNLGTAYEKLGKYREASQAVGIAAGLMPTRTDVAKRALDLRDKSAAPSPETAAPSKGAAPNAKPSG